MLNTLVQSLNWTLVGNIPVAQISNANQNGTPSYAQIYQGDLLIFNFLWFVRGFVCVRIKSNGNYCVYASANYQIGRAQWGMQPENSDVVQSLGGGFYYLVSHGVVYYFQLPDFFDNGKIVTVAENTYPDNLSCGNFPIVGVFRDAIKNLFAVEYAQSFPDASNIFASIYKSNVRINSGFIGNFPNGSDGFNRVNLAFPQYVLPSSGMDAPAYFYTRTGVAYTSLVYVNPPFAVFGSSAISINNGSQLNCTDPNNSVYVASSAAINHKVSDYPLLSQMVTGTQYNSGASDSDILVVFGTGGSAFFGFDTNNLYIFGNAQDVRPIVAGLLTASKIAICLTADGLGGYNILTAPLVLSADPPLSVAKNLLPVFHTARIVQ